MPTFPLQYRRTILWHHLQQTSLLALLITTSLISAAEADHDAGAPAKAASAATPTSDSDLTGSTDAAHLRQLQRLKQQLGDHDLLAIDGGQLWWRDQDQGLIIDGFDDRRQVLVGSQLGQIAVHIDLLQQPQSVNLLTLQQLIAVALDAGLPVQPGGHSGLTYRHSPLTGLRLIGNKLVVVPGGVLRQHAKLRSHDATLSDLSAQVTALTQRLKTEKTLNLSADGRSTMNQVLQQLSLQQPADPDGDEITPDFARQVVRHGWLRQQLPAAWDEVRAVERTLAALSEDRPMVRFHGAAGSISNMSDAFSNDRWIIATDHRRAAALDAVIPSYHWPAQDHLGKAMVIAEFATDVDPYSATAFDQPPQRVQLLHEGQTLATWSADEGLVSDETIWRRVFPAQGPRLYDDTLQGYMPPHIALADHRGDMRYIFTEHGVLHSPGSMPDEQWFNQAAAILVDPPHLDLIGQYLFKYVYDSPEPTRPTLIGNGDIRGDIHQTSQQTLATAAGGVCRGDCDDLSEFYHYILTKQGKLPHVISLPAHAAVAWVEERPDQEEHQRWHAFVMQTGPSLEFAAATVQEALAKVYGHFDANDTFDPNGVGLLLRFAGENTRSGWRLSYRIFTEADYAHTMIDVQRDWHYHTYLQAVRKMEVLMAAGDSDNANYRELAGLYRITGQYDLAAEALIEARQRTTEASSRAYLTAEILSHLVSDENYTAARQELHQLLNDRLPEVEESIGDAMISFTIQLAGSVHGGLQPEIMVGEAIDILDTWVSPQMEEWTTNISSWINSDRFSQEVWERHDQFNYLRRMMSWYHGTLISIVANGHSDRQPATTTAPGDAQAETAGETANIASQEHTAGNHDGNPQHNPALAQMLNVTQQWLDDIAFHGIEEPSDTLRFYATSGAFYQAILGEQAFLHLLQQAALPQPDNSIDHAHRSGGLPQMMHDLPWINISPEFWISKINEVMYYAEGRADQTSLALYAKQFEQALREAERHGMLGNWESRRATITRINIAMLQQNSAALKQQLAIVAAQQDRQFYEDAAQALGSVARLTDLDWYRNQALPAWRQQVNYKPKSLWIAWQAKVNRAPQHALAAAESAVAAFPDYAPFSEELAFMTRLVSQEQEAAEE